MTITERLRSAVRRSDQRSDAAALAQRVDGLTRFATAAEPHLGVDAVRPARVVVASAGARLDLSRDHTVVALSGATGSGKSSLFNALAGIDLSPVGVRRPTTDVPYACVWQHAGAAPLLDWLDIVPEHRFLRESPLDAEDQAALRGLVLLDLPDLDSVEVTHRDEVDRLLRRVDLVVWVTDPQKYADQVIHDEYLRVFHRHQQNMVVVLNQADRLSDPDIARCLADLRNLLRGDGLGAVPLFATSATAARPGLDDLRDALERAVAARLAAFRRLSADIDESVAQLKPLVGRPVDRDGTDRAAVRDLTDALAVSAGVPAVAEATSRAYRFRAGKSMGWVLTRWTRHLRVDPLVRMQLAGMDAATAGTMPLPDAMIASTVAETTESTASEPTAGAPSEPTVAERSTADLGVRTIGARAGAGLPEEWAAAVAAAAVSRSAELPDALDRAVAATDLGVRRRPWWWWLLNALQWLATIAALAGAVWSLARLGLVALELPTYDVARVGPLPLPIVLLCGGVLAGIALALLSVPLAAAGARQARARAATRLRRSIFDVGTAYVVEPVRRVLGDYTDARDALAVAARRVEPADPTEPDHPAEAATHA
ncbi:MAG TPA: GTPase [Micromonosporaceae bacterium]|nr:GTPase [Micromonosporaceae bacterium]